MPSINESDQTIKNVVRNDSILINSDESDEQSINEESLYDGLSDHKIDKIEAQVDSSHELKRSAKKKKKKRSRKKKKKNDFNDIQNKGITGSNESEKLSLLKPEVIEGLSINKENKVSKYNVLDELSRDIRRIQSIKVQYLLELPFWQRFVQRTGRVVAIIEAIHSRKAGGRLTHMKEKNQNWALFIPNDSRMPRMRIAMKSCPPDFVHHSQHFAQSLFIAQLEDWKTTDTFPSGQLLKHLGNFGDIEAESELLLLENNIDFLDFPDSAYYGLPNIEDDQWMTTDQQFPIPDKEFRYRRDFRDDCVFTIDPSTARDLDDALSIKRLNDDHFEVGVHIADVSYFLKEDMPLDEIARSRATSVYLVQKVIPMLPRTLCEKLCSLNAGEEKLTFSVIWTVDRNGNILEEWFGLSTKMLILLRSGSDALSLSLASN